jgi:hypothetical protein
MERNSQDKIGYQIESQIREAYGRVTYSQTCRDKLIHRLETLNSRIKLWQIILSALTTGSIITTLLSNKTAATILAAILSTILLVLNSYAKNFELIEKSNKHKSASDLLWKIREEYVSLLTDFEDLTLEEIREKRDDLQQRTHEVYLNYPRTDSKSYQLAQRALKTEEEQTFSDSEIDVMLPNSIRRTNR